MDKIELNALAKVNLGLDILGQREDGYHQVRMVMQTVYLYDQVTLEKMREPQIQVKSNLKFLPVNDTNIAWKAAELLKQEFGISDGIRITLDKHIPVAAGLAGGSTDGAAVLYGLNRMYGLGLSEQELMNRGVLLGADVPYCIMRGTVLAEGIGEKLSPLPALPKCYLLIAKPSMSASTEQVYKKYDALPEPEHPDLDAVLQGLRDSDLKQVASRMGNVLEQVMIPEYPVIGAIKDEMKATGALGAMMSGSGPSVFGIYEKRSLAKAAAKQIRSKRLARQVYVANVHNVRRKS